MANWLRMMRSCLNEQGQPKYSVVFLSGECIEKHFYINPEKPICSTSESVVELLRPEFDVIAVYSEQRDNNHLKFYKGYGAFRGLKDKGREDPSEEEEMGGYLGSLLGDYQDAYQEGVALAEQRLSAEPKAYEGEPARLVQELDEYIFQQRDVRALIILDDFDHCMQAILNDDNLKIFRHWTMKSDLWKNGHLFVLISKSNPLDSESGFPQIVRACFNPTNSQSIILDNPTLEDVHDALIAQHFKGVLRLARLHEAPDIAEFLMPEMEQRSMARLDPRILGGTGPLTLDDIIKAVGGKKRKAKRSLEDVKAELESLIGLESVKRQINNLMDFIHDKKILNELAEGPGHYLFLGPPGTGKTTVGILFGEFLRLLGVLSKGQFIEAKREMLIGQYSGHTAPMTAKVVQSALGGVLFLDEVYRLKTDERDAFGQECIDTLVPYLSEYASDFVCIAAGYTEPTFNRFLKANPGLKDRFVETNHLYFQSYTAENLVEIFKRKAKNKNRYLGEGLEDSLLKIFENMVENAGDDFGNARKTEGLLKAMEFKKASRVKRIIPAPKANDPIRITLEVDDIPDIYL